MRLAKTIVLTSALITLFATLTDAGTIISEHVTGGYLDLPWTYGFATPNTMYGKTLDPSDPAYANPSGDHTVAVAQNASPDSGGICVTVTDPGAIGPDYAWEGWFFTGDGSTRRGLIVRATPANNFESFYQLVIESGLFQIRFRKLINGAPTTLATWYATALPAGSVPVNTWHKMKVVGTGSEFRCYVDDFELTTTPIVDSDIAAGWPGCYNFRFDLGNVPVYFDDLTLDADVATPAHFKSWGGLKARFK